MMHANRTRIAPTPSGFLHVGNALSFAITAAVAGTTGAEVLLRIDDLDQARVREEYLQDVFDTLDFLGIPWQKGPVNVADFRDHFTQEKRMPLYEQALDRLREGGWAFGCDCSRSGLAATRCTCGERSLSLDAPGISWRLRTEASGLIQFQSIHEETISARMPESMRDFIVRKKDGRPSYQLASVCDDVHWNIDLVVRGRDLFDSTIAQQFLARCLGAQVFQHARFCHHPLIEENGSKLSKSAGADSIRFLRGQKLGRQEVYQLIAAKTGIRERVTNWQSLVENLPFVIS